MSKNSCKLSILSECLILVMGVSLGGSSVQADTLPPTGQQCYQGHCYTPSPHVGPNSPIQDEELVVFPQGVSSDQMQRVFNELNALPEKIQGLTQVKILAQPPGHHGISFEVDLSFVNEDAFRDAMDSEAMKQLRKDIAGSIDQVNSSLDLRLEK